MKHPLPNLESVKVFESAARNLSFSNAAEELCITKGAVSYQIKKLESDLGCQLFNRDIRQVWLTDEGQKLQQIVKPLFADLNRIVSQIKQPRNLSTVSIAVTTYVASRWLSPLLTHFLISNPEIALSYQHTVNAPTFNIDDTDIAIQWAKCYGNLTTPRLKEIPMAMFPVCSPMLSQRIPANLNDVVLLCEEREQDLWQEWAGNRFDLSSNPRRVIADANVRVQAAIDSQGLILADDMMTAEITSGALVRVTRHALDGYGYVIMSSNKRNRGPVERLTEWLKNQ